jgi:(S)-2-hydroxy-acid oxidase
MLLSVSCHNKSNKKPILLNLHEYELYLQDNLPRNAKDYYHSGSNDMITFRENRAAFSRLAIIPRVLRDVSQINTRVRILGNEITSPICIAPTAMQRMAHADGEIATSRAASRFGTIMTLSSLSTTSLEEVIDAPSPSSSTGSLFSSFLSPFSSASADKKGIYWFQLYVYRNDDITLDLIRRAEKAGYQAIVITVDTPTLGRREADLRNKFAMPSHLTLNNFQKYYENSQKGSSSPSSSGSPAASTLTMKDKPTLSSTDSSSSNSSSAVAGYFSLLINDGISWEGSINWIKQNTKLKIILKGIMTPEDAKIAMTYPIDAIWISNHGARQLDTALATIEVLSSIAAVVQKKCELYIDGGIMRGTDVFKVSESFGFLSFLFPPSLLFVPDLGYCSWSRCCIFRSSCVMGIIV